MPHILKVYACKEATITPRMFVAGQSDWLQEPGCEPGPAADGPASAHAVFASAPFCTSHAHSLQCRRVCIHARTRHL